MKMMKMIINYSRMLLGQSRDMGKVDMAVGLIDLFQFMASSDFAMGTKTSFVPSLLMRIVL